MQVIPCQNENKKPAVTDNDRRNSILRHYDPSESNQNLPRTHHEATRIIQSWWVSGEFLSRFWVVHGGFPVGFDWFRVGSWWVLVVSSFIERNE